MIQREDEEGPYELHEPAVLELLLQLDEDLIFDDRPVSEQVADLVKRHEANLTQEQLELLKRAGEVELEHAGWIGQARVYGFELQVFSPGDDPAPFRVDFEYKVTWRSATASTRSGSRSALFDDERKMLEQVDKLRRAGGLSYLHVTSRPMGQWRDFTGMALYYLDEGRQPA